jgi:DNA-binding transcriptional MerR regulator
MSASVAPYHPAESDVAVKRSPKAEDAYRTISEVADELHVAQHVLRFWESKFKQIEPLKRAGGRRYYRREDVDLLKRIHYLLYSQGYTIKGVQKLLIKDRNLTQAVPHLQNGSGADQAAGAWSAPPVVASVLAAAPVASEPAPVADDHSDQLNLFAASDRVFMNDILRRLKKVQDMLAV